MFTSMKSKLLVLSLIVLLLMLVASSEVRVFPELPKVGKKINSELLLRELRNIARKSEFHNKRSMLGKLDRISPAGPDPQHH
ncbi:hypothetical protein L6164_018379 [Bauhinia variegata]|uniref:Uncharacterized protein n=1 Tax=Bauhinia variegata TaxID=167791 RepID=A0ACB9NB15_BAUVA|nr:hypothetical protein L6164_018379 [Bauhinia variegata]